MPDSSPEGAVAELGVRVSVVLALVTVNVREVVARLYAAFGFDVARAMYGPGGTTGVIVTSATPSASVTAVAGCPARSNVTVCPATGRLN